MAMSCSPKSSAENPGNHGVSGHGQCQCAVGSNGDAIGTNGGSDANGANGGSGGGETAEPPGRSHPAGPHESASMKPSSVRDFDSVARPSILPPRKPSDLNTRSSKPIQAPSRAPSESKRIHLMLVEDNPGDVYLTRDIIEQMCIDCQLTVVEDGEKAVQLLRRKDHGSGNNFSLPDLVLLDLNLPRKTGREVLADIRDDPQLAHLPVVVLTSSGHTDDMAEMLGHGASSYLLKPMGRADIMHALDLIPLRPHEST